MPIQTTYKEAKTQFARLWDQVINNQEVVIISKRGTEDIALISASELSELLKKNRPLMPAPNIKRLSQSSKRSGSKKKAGFLQTHVGRDTEQI